MGPPCSSMGGLGGIYWLAVASAGANSRARIQAL